MRVLLTDSETATEEAGGAAHKLELTADEIEAAEELVADVVETATFDGDGALARELALRAQELPLRLRRFLDDMRRLETTAVSVVSGFPVEDDALGPTPSQHASRKPSPTAREETLFVMCGSLLGDVFGWATQQDGMIVHDISPIPGHEYEQLGSGSAELLQWHTEEAFHPLRCDYLGLMCLRNPDRVATLVASVDELELDADVRDVLFERRFVIRPDLSHLGRANGPLSSSKKERRLLEAARARIRSMNESPQPLAVLYGDVDSPYLCVDPFYMETLPGDDRARAALDILEQAVDAKLRDVVLRPGEICFIDNFRAVHGRSPFQARYDDGDRWLKRINITRDLRRSRAHRVSSDSRVVY